MIKKAVLETLYIVTAKNQLSWNNFYNFYKIQELTNNDFQSSSLSSAIIWVHNGTRWD